MTQTGTQDGTPMPAILRKTWAVDHLDIVDEPMIISMAKYRQYEDRTPSEVDANVVSSHIVGSRQHAPILDLDFEHAYVPSTTPGHGHLSVQMNIPSGRVRRIIHRTRVLFLYVVWKHVFHGELQ